MDAPSERSEERFEKSWATRHPALGWEFKILAFKMPDGGFLVRYKVVTAEGRVEVSDGHCGTWTDVLAFAQEHNPSLGLDRMPGADGVYATRAGASG